MWPDVNSSALCVFQCVCFSVCTCLSTWVPGAAGCRCDEPQIVICRDRQSEDSQAGAELTPSDRNRTEQNVLDLISSHHHERQSIKHSQGARIHYSRR